jgi:hypothetical protein
MKDIVEGIHDSHVLTLYSSILTNLYAVNPAAPMTDRYRDVKQRATSGASVGVVFTGPTAALG